jgi:glycerophosphoryl diester phosphodiesterase
MSAMTAVFAHRGCTEGFLENTVEAFAEARRRGADGVELDVRLTADGALAVHHDAVIAGHGPVSEMAVSRLPSHVPLLEDVLDVCDGMVVNVEIKNDPRDPGYDATESIAGVVARALAETDWTSRVIVSSFQVSTLQAVQVADPNLAIGTLWPFLTEYGPALEAAAAAGWQAVHPFVSEVSEDMLSAAHALGLAVNVWTVNATHDLEAFCALGVDAVITDTLTAALSIARAPGPSA